MDKSALQVITWPLTRVGQKKRESTGSGPVPTNDPIDANAVGPSAFSERT
jgi:hypothetical protein